MDDLKMSLSAQDAELIGQALDVYATTLLCAPLGLGLDLLVSVRELRKRLGDASDRQRMVGETVDKQSNVYSFARP